MTSLLSDQEVRRDLRPEVLNAKPFCLPMTAMFSVRSYEDRVVAHALDFDLVAVAKDAGEAIRKLRTTVKHHVEFGLKHNFDLDILLPAPERFWHNLENSTFSMGDPIHIDHCVLYPVMQDPRRPTHEDSPRSRTAQAA